jgi:hypothetical protein
MKNLLPVGSRKIGTRTLRVYRDAIGNEYVRTESGELVRPDAAKKFKKPYPLPTELAQVAVEVMGDFDPQSLSENERIDKMHRFFTEAFENAQERLARIGRS